MPQNTNLNIAPYFDDFDKANNFYRVLFRPGYPIQARELTTLQSLMQNQVESFGTHMFKDGSMVIPGQIGYDLDAKAVILQGSFLGADVEQYRDQITGTIVEGLTTGIKAKVLFSISSTESERGYITLYVKYLTSGGEDSDTRQFVNNEQLICASEITFENLFLSSLSGDHSLLTSVLPSEPFSLLYPLLSDSLLPLPFSLSIQRFNT